MPDFLHSLGLPDEFVVDFVVAAEERGLSPDEYAADLLLRAFRLGVGRPGRTFTVPATSEELFRQDGFRVVGRCNGEVEFASSSGLSFEQASDALLDAILADSESRELYLTK